MLNSKYDNMCDYPHSVEVEFRLRSDYLYKYTVI